MTKFVIKVQNTKVETLTYEVDSIDADSAIKNYKSMGTVVHSSVQEFCPVLEKFSVKPCDRKLPEGKRDVQ